MAIEVTMPQLSDTMDEGTILTWLKKEGETVSRGDALAEVATDKADLEIESFHEGTLLKIHSPEGTTVKVGEIIAVIGAEGEAVAPSAAAPTPQQEPAQQAPAQQTATQQAPQGQAQQAPAQQAATQQAPAPQGQAQQAPAQQEQPSAATAATPEAPTAHVNGDARVKISPLAKNLAQSYGVDYTAIQGSGEGGRIVKRDIEQQVGQPISSEQVEAAVSGSAATVVTAVSTPMTEPSPAQQAPAQQAPAQQVPARQAPAQPPVQTRPSTPAPAPGGQSVETLSKMRQTIAQRMVDSVNTAPHFYLTTKINVDKLMKLRKTLKELPQYEGITFNHLVVKATALALRAHPRINAFYKEGTLVQPQDVNIGIITALPDGLLIPVLKQADYLPLAEVVGQANELVQRARSGRPKADDLVGGTFSISNIGKADVESFTAIINPGQGAILAVSGILQEPVVVDGKLSVGNTMRVTLSVDHRIIDGLVGGQFVTELKRLLEEPVLLVA